MKMKVLKQKKGKLKKTLLNRLLKPSSKVKAKKKKRTVKKERKVKHGPLVVLPSQVITHEQRHDLGELKYQLFVVESAA